IHFAHATGSQMADYFELSEPGSNHGVQSKRWSLPDDEKTGDVDCSILRAAIRSVFSALPNVKIRSTLPGRLTYDEEPAPDRLRRHDRFGPRPRRPSQPRSARNACSLRAYPPLESGAPELVDLLRASQQPAPQRPHADQPGKRWESRSQMGLSIALPRQARGHSARRRRRHV